VVKPAGEWNSARVRVEDGQVEHWLNGQKIVEYVLGSPDWQERVANSKFADWPEYGRARSGHIGLQDHGDPVWFRDIKIRVLDE
jgi:cytochrome c